VDFRVASCEDQPVRAIGQRFVLRPLLLLALSGVAAGVVVQTAAAVSHDQQLAVALVVPHRDVPAYWDATILPNPCSISSYPEHVSIVARAATRWGSITHGLWSVAAITGSAAQGRRSSIGRAELSAFQVTTHPSSSLRSWRGVGDPGTLTRASSPPAP
jgi:hypothetical protein